MHGDWCILCIFYLLSSFIKESPLVSVKHLYFSVSIVNVLWFKWISMLISISVGNCFETNVNVHSRWLFKWVKRKLKIDKKVWCQNLLQSKFNGKKCCIWNVSLFHFKQYVMAIKWCWPNQIWFAFFSFHSFNLLLSYTETNSVIFLYNTPPYIIY